MNLIVFDIDDTLTKSESQHQTAFIEAMQYFGINSIDTNWSKYKHHTDSYILSVNYERNLKSDFQFDFIQAFEAMMLEYIQLLPKFEAINGAPAIVKAIAKSEDYFACFATGSLLEPAYLKLEQAKIPHNRNVVVSSNNIFDREGIVAQAIKQAKQVAGVEQFQHILSVGDGIWDLNTAKNLGVSFLGIGNKNLAAFQAANIKNHIEDWQNFKLDNFRKLLD